MRKYSGEGTLTYDDGDTTVGEAMLLFTKIDGRNVGKGFFKHPRALALHERAENPIITIGSLRIRVILATANMEGASIVTEGPPL